MNLDPISSMYLEKRIMCPYDETRIAWELDQIALGNAFYGNALRVAKDLEFLTDHDRSVLDAYATGKAGVVPRPAIHIDLHEIAIKIRAQQAKGE